MNTSRWPMSRTAGIYAEERSLCSLRRNDMSAKVMCVDDSPTIRMLVKQNLVPEGFEIIEATDGQDGLNKLSTDIGLFLVDINMPVKN